MPITIQILHIKIQDTVDNQGNELYTVTNSLTGQVLFTDPCDGVCMDFAEDYIEKVDNC